MSTEPQIINKGQYKVIDPNPLGHTIDHEDLYTYVSLSTKTKGRTFLTQKEDGNIEIEALDLKSDDLVASKNRNYLGTDWTEIGGSQISTAPIQGDLEGFGITNIDIEIKSSFIPKVTIDFVDIRGATLFEQGSCSPYSVFFHLPYPVFELTVKGYYGKPVRYYLNLVKFNTKFNAETGNFESKGEFIGWSYAFLADMLMGFVMAAGKMYDWESNSVLQKKYKETVKYYEDNGLFDRSTFSSERINNNSDNPFCKTTPYGQPDCITIVDLLKKFEGLKKFLSNVKGSVDFDEITNLLSMRADVQRIVSDLQDMSRELVKKGNAEEPVLSKESNRPRRERLIFKSPPNEESKNIFSNYLKRVGPNDNSDGTIVTSIGLLKSRVIREKSPKTCGGTIIDLATTGGDCVDEVEREEILDKLNNENWLKGFSEFNWKDGNLDDNDRGNNITAFIDLGYLLNEIEKDIKILDDKIDEKRETVREFINEGVADELGFLPTIRNVFTILAANTETFMELLLSCNISAEKHHNERQEEYESDYSGTEDSVIHEKRVFPWPTYYEKKYNDITSNSEGQKNETQTKEVYPGEKAEFQTWEEVRFVEDFLRAMLDLKRELELLAEDKTGVPGFDNYIPLSPLENKIYGDTAIKYLDLDDTNNGDISGERALSMIGEKMFVILHHHFLDPVHINECNAEMGYIPSSEEYKKYKFIQYKNKDLISNMGKADADNLLNTIQKSQTLQVVKQEIESGNLLDSIKNSLSKIGVVDEKKLVEANPSWGPDDDTKVLLDDKENIYEIGRVFGAEDNYITYTPKQVDDKNIPYIELLSKEATNIQPKIRIKPNHYEMESQHVFRLIDKEELGQVSAVNFNTDNEEVSQGVLDNLNSIINDTLPGSVRPGKWEEFETTKGFYFKGDSLYSPLGITGKNLWDNNQQLQDYRDGLQSNMGIVGYLTQYNSITDVGLRNVGYNIFLNKNDPFGANNGDLILPCVGNHIMFREDSEAYHTISRSLFLAPTLEIPNEGLFSGAKLYGNRDNSIAQITSGEDFIEYSEKTTPSEKQKKAWAETKIFDHLIQTPLWSDNVNRFRKVLGDNKKLETPPPNANVEPEGRQYNSKDIEYRNLAYLFLAGLKPSPLITMGLQSNKKYERVENHIRQVYPKALFPMLQMGGIQEVPRVWVLGMGATLWRWKCFMGVNKDENGTILWRHPLWGDGPIGLDPLAQPGHPNNQFSKTISRKKGIFGGVRDIRSYTGPTFFNTESILVKAFNKKTPDLKNSTNNFPIQKSVFKDNLVSIDDTVKRPMGYFFDYWGVYNNDPNLNNRVPQSKKFQRLTWGKWKRELPKEYKDDFYLDKHIEQQFKTVEDATERTVWPLLWVTPWQHFYTEPININGEGSPYGTTPDSEDNQIIEKHLIFIPLDKPYREYSGSFWGGRKWTRNGVRSIKGNGISRDVTINKKYLKSENNKAIDVIFQGSESNKNLSSSFEGGYGRLIALLPNHIKERFVEEFEKWVDNEWAPNPDGNGFTSGWLSKVDPLNYFKTANDKDLMGKSYTVKSFNGQPSGYVRPGSQIYGTTSSDALEKHFLSQDITEAFGKEDFLGWTCFNDSDDAISLYQHLFEEHYVMVNTTPKSWNAVYQDYDYFTANKTLAEIYLQGFKQHFDENFSKRLNSINKNDSGDESIFSDTAIDDADTKLSLYRSFKSLSDKWISSSSKEGNDESRMFFNIVDNEYTQQGSEEPIPLAGHFSYVNRVMSEIGNKSVLDVTKLEKIQDNPKMSLYQVISETLSENQFDFFPLPSFTNFSSGKDEELKDMFRPINTLTGVNSGPNFICMFVGGTSRILDLKPRANCSIDQDDLNYDDDSFSLIDEGANRPSEYNPSEPFKPNKNDRIEGAGFTAFKVAYGLENQNHFKNITLDQTEFSETNESLLLIDRLAKGGDPANRETKGQNLHNVYLTRSYNCGAETLGNMMIQPLQYFELTNTPMFHGTYIITEVKHNIKPHHIGTSFKGVRQPIATVPIITDVAVAMNLTIRDLKTDKEGLLLDDIASQNGGGSGGITNSDGGTGNNSSPIGTIPSNPKVVNGIEYVDWGDTKGYLNNGVINTAPKFKTPPTGIVLHWTGSWSLEDKNNPSRKGALSILKEKGLHYHFSADEEGTLHQIGDLTRVTYHGGCPTSKCSNGNRCADMNWGGAARTIGINYIGGWGDSLTPDARGKDNVGTYVRTKDDWNNENLMRNDKYPFNSKKQWESLLNACILAKAEHPTIGFITSHHWTSSDKSDVGDEFPWDKFLSDLRAKDSAFDEVIIKSDWVDTTCGTGKLVRGSAPEYSYTSVDQELEDNKGNPSDYYAPGATNALNQLLGSGQASKNKADRNLGYNQKLTYIGKIKG